MGRGLRKWAFPAWRGSSHAGRDLLAASRCLQGDYGVPGQEDRGREMLHRGQKLHRGKNTFVVRTVRSWHRLPREVVHLPCFDNLPA